MMSRWTRWGAPVLLILMLSACSVRGSIEGGPVGAAPESSTPSAASPSATPQKQVPSPSATAELPPAEAPAAATSPPASLAEQLEKGPLPTVAATYRWKRPSAGLDYQPLLPGLLLTYTRFLPRGSSAPFVMGVIDASGKELWQTTLPFTNQEVEYLDVAADGERISVIQNSGKVTVLDARTGSVVVSRQFAADAVSIRFIDRGRLLAVETETPSGIYRRAVDVYALTDVSQKALYGVQGSDVFTSPYHGMLLGVVPEGVEVVGPTGSLGVVEGALPQRGVRMNITGDGRWVFVWGSDSERLRIYDVHLRPVGAPIPAEYNELSFPAFASLYYKGHTAFFMDGTSRTLEFDRSRWRINQVLPGGEAELVPTGKERKHCIVTTRGDLFGCFPWVLWGRNAEGTLLWYSDQDWINAYRL